MRILYLIPTLDGGGAERQLALLAPALAQSGVETGVAFHSGGPNYDLLNTGEVDLLPLPARGNHHPMQLWDIISLVRIWKPDLIQTYLTKMDILGGLAAKITRTPHILSERSSAMMYAQGWKNTARVGLGKSAKAIIANSEGGAHYWRSLGAAGQIDVIPNALRPLKTAEPEHPWEGKPYLVSAGRLSPEKNAVTAAKALIAALKRMPTVYAAIIGDGPDRDLVADIVSNSGVSERLRILGYTDKLDTWLRYAVAYISASYVEGHPNVVMEAAQAKCPLILSDIPAHWEAIGNGATYVEAENIDGFTDALVTTMCDPAATANHVRNALAKTKALQFDAIIPRYRKLYWQCLQTGVS